VSDGAIPVQIASSVAQFPAAAWDALTDGNPFVSHAFLTAMEDSHSVGGRSGWNPAPLVVLGADGALIGAAPAYLKSHSQGEYVFDHGWADAWHRAGGHYYPKLQIAAPFTPATGPRLLCRDPAVAAALLAGAEALCAQNGLSSAHATFIAPDQVPLFEQAGWLLRNDIQFHWENRGYASFDDFLGTLASASRFARSAAATCARSIGTRSGSSIRIPARASGAGPISPARPSACWASGWPIRSCCSWPMPMAGRSPARSTSSAPMRSMAATGGP
jgi:hypothetical protein